MGMLGKSTPRELDDEEPPEELDEGLDELEEESSLVISSEGGYLLLIIAFTPAKRAILTKSASITDNNFFMNIPPFLSLSA